MNNCQSCREPKAELQTKKSAVLPDLQIRLCARCTERNFEPRYMIVLAARSYGIKTVTKHIKDHLYVGDPITGSELIV